MTERCLVHGDHDWQWSKHCPLCGMDLPPAPLNLQPQQPILVNTECERSERFRENTIVRYLLDHGGIDLNMIGDLPFPRADRIQFAQLIGYSVKGFGELNYVDEGSYQEAIRQRGDLEHSAA